MHHDFPFTTQKDIYCHFYQDKSTAVYGLVSSLGLTIKCKFCIMDVSKGSYVFLCFYKSGNYKCTV